MTLVDTLWFGNTSRFVEVPAPDLPFTASAAGYSETFTGEAGGFYSQISQGESRQYQFVYGINSQAELGKFLRFKRGSFGAGLVNFANPFAFESNLFSPAWAEPGLIEGDWPSNYDTVPSFSNVAANSYDQPLRKATYTITQAANTAPVYQSSRFLLPIPPAYTLWLGCSGAKTGTAVVHVDAVDISAASTTGSNLTLLADTSATRLNSSFAGSSYDYAVVDFRRTNSDASTLTVTSMLAQLWPTGVTPVLTGDHRPGEGHTGLVFSGATFGLEQQVMTEGENFLGAAFTLAEVGAWKR